MKNNYDDLQEFVINVIDGFIFNWNAGDSYRSYGLNFINTHDISKEIVEIHIMSYKTNELKISIKDKKQNLNSITVNTDKVPNLLSYIAEKQNTHSFQFSGINRQLNENEFNELNKITDEVLLKGKFNEKPLIQNEEYTESFDLELNQNEKMSFWIQPIDNYKLGLQKVVTHIKRLNTGSEIGFNRVIPIHQLEDFPFLKSIAQVPFFTSEELTPDIYKFISFFSNSKCDHVGVIAKKFDLRLQLEDELEPKNNENSKRLKI